MGRTFWLLVGLVALAPFPLGANRPAAWSLLSLGVGVLLVLWSLSALRRPDRLTVPWRRHWPASVGFLLLIVWLVVQSSSLTPLSWHDPMWRQASHFLGGPLAGAIGLTPDAAYVGITRLLAYGGIFWLALQYGRSERRARVLLWSLVVAATLYAAYGLVVMATGNKTILWYAKWAYPDSLTATFVNRNNFATYAGLALLTAVALLKRRLRQGPATAKAAAALPVERFLAAAGLPLMAILVLGAALLSSHSRGGLLALFCGLAVLLAGEAFGHGKPRSARLLAAGMLAVTALLVTVGGGQTLQRLNQQGVDSADKRGWIYERSLAALADRPLTGFGYGGFEHAFEGHRDLNDFKLGRIDKAHDSYLEFAVEAGLPALGLMLCLLGWLSWRCLVGLRTRQRDATYPELGLAASVLVGTHSLVDFSVQIPAVAVVYCLLLGVGFSQSWSARTA